MVKAISAALQALRIERKRLAFSQSPIGTYTESMLNRAARLNARDCRSYEAWSFGAHCFNLSPCTPIVRTVSKFKARCIGLLKNVQKSREPLLVTLRGEPIARVEPVVPPKRQVRLGALKGWMEIKGDIIRSDIEKDFLVQ
jgi:antitoxin (DNA-binding transcriptional repressor) of toxin-antitoxin stability system